MGPAVAAALLAALCAVTAAAWPAPRPMVAVPTLAPPAADAPYLLLVDSLSSPALGIDSASPRFSWAAPATIRAQVSANLTVRVAASGAVVWAVRLATSAQALSYDGPELLPATTYSWSVTLVGADGHVTQPAAPALFVTGLHGVTAATPVWAPAAGGGGGANQSASFVFLRYEAALPNGPLGPLVSAVAFVTAAPQAYVGPNDADNAKLLGGYKLWVNGALSGVGPGKVSRCGPLCPVQNAGPQGSCTCAPEHLYDSRDIAGAAAANATHITLALAGFNYPPATLPALPVDSRLWAQVFLTFASGAVAMFGTDTQWRAFDATGYMGPSGNFGAPQWYTSPQENFDARLEPVGWQLPGFDASSWPAAAAVAPKTAPFSAPLVARPSLALAIAEGTAAVAPPLLVQNTTNATFVDFGTDFSGGVCLDATAGVDGTRLAMRIGEEAVAGANGSFSVRPMRTGNVYAQTWTLRAGTQTICMHEYAQFRYASVETPPGSPSPAEMGVTLRAWVAYYPAPYVPLDAFEAASAGDGNVTAAALLSVYGLSWYTRFAQSFDMYFDHVRQRDVYCVEEMTVDLYLQYSLSAEWALQPLVLAYIINNRPGGFGWAEWPALVVREVHEVYEFSGDLSLFAANYDELLTYTLAPLINPATGLWTCPPGSTTLNCNQPEVDWPPTSRDGFVFTPTNAVVNAIAYAALLRFADMAAALGGHDADVALLTAQAGALRAAMNAGLWNNATGAYRDGLTTAHEAWHSTAFALGMGVPTPEMAPAVAAALVARLPAGNASATSCFPSSVWPTQWALEGLYAGAPSDHGRSGLALMTCPAENGWVGMLAQGATQAPEAWSPEVKGNLEWGMTWGAAPGDIVPRYVLGVRPTAPGFAAALVQPQPGALTLVAGTVPTLRGPIGVRFTQALSSSSVPTAARLELELPGNLPAAACVPLPACPGARVLLDGAPTPAEVRGDYACVNVTAVASGPRIIACPASGGGASVSGGSGGRV